MARRATAKGSRKDDADYEFGRMPHGIASDRRLSASDRVVVMALLYYALKRAFCTVSDGRLADYVGINVATIKRSLSRLQRLGYIDRQKTPKTDDNLTGRTIVLYWVKDSSCLPLPPTRKVQKDEFKATRTSAPVRQSVAQKQPTQSRTDARLSSASVRYKEEGNYVPEDIKDTPSSSSGKSNDDERQDFNPLMELPEGTKAITTEAIEAVAECFDVTLANVVKADEVRIGKRINGRWDCFAGAIYQTHSRGAKVDVDRRIGYAITTTNDFASSGGVPAETIAYRDKLRKKLSMAAKAKADAERRKALEMAEGKRVIAEHERAGWQLVLMMHGTTQMAKAYPTSVESDYLPSEYENDLKRHYEGVLDALRGQDRVTREEWDSLVANEVAMINRLRAKHAARLPKIQTGKAKSSVIEDETLVEPFEKTVENPLTLTRGSRVMHPHYGAGNITNITSDDIRSRRVSVSFDVGEARVFVLARCPLQVIATVSQQSAAIGGPEPPLLESNG